MRKFISKGIAAFLTFCITAFLMAYFIPYNSFEAEAANVTQSDIQKIKDKIAANDKKIKETNEKIKNLSADIENYLETVEQLQNKISDLESNISDTKALIEKYNQLIQQTESQIYERENQINAKYDDFLEIIRRSYEEGTKTYLEMLFDAEGLVDFLSRADRLGSIISYEQTMLAQLESEISDLKNLTLTLESAKKETQDLDAYQANSEAELKKSLEEAENQLKKLQSDEAALKKVQQQAAALDKQLDKELESTIKKYNEQQAQAEKEKLWWPVDSEYNVVSSPYGWRTLWDKERDFHLGIDIVGKKAGEIKGANIYASADGKVIKATYNSSYGWYILIDHENSISTLYAHCTKIIVKVGQRVSQGETIGYVGTTGHSSGYHLHFEVRINGSTTNPLAKNGNSKQSWLVIKSGNKYLDPIANNLITIRK